MPEPSVDSLRSQLRERGYLSHGLERWFALDPWSSRTFWVELTVVALKAATLIAAFGALPHVAIMLFRNGPLGTVDTLLLFVLYAALWFAGAFAFVVVIALLMKIRPELAVDTPRALLAISIAAASLVVAPAAGWWWLFGTMPSTAELATGGALIALLFIVAALVISAALLSFSIYELHRIPAIHQRPRTVPLAIGAALLIALLFVPARATTGRAAAAPDQIVTRPAAQRTALVAVDGLTWDIARSRPDLLEPFESAQPLQPVAAPSAAERWASAGTGVPPELHGVRALAGVRLAGSHRILQSISGADFLLRDVAPALGLAELQPLPPTVRRRHFIWESLAGRGMPAVAVNWWTSARETSGALTSIGQETIYGGSRGDPLRVDAAAIRRLQSAAGDDTRFVTIYLPALDVILNRTSADRGSQLGPSLRAIDGIVEVVGWLRAQAYEVLLVGMPGEGQSGRGVIAATIELDEPASAWDVIPTVAHLAGFPPSQEMPGRSLAPGRPLPPIDTYGERSRTERAPAVDQEYYESL
ncbi:MAG TPA: hypothetical protein VM779_01390, partial [Thermoanaerobaculia bacterium]|nr:hypothetical protein [Thermoanaerobaculia bacterium]